MTGIPDECCEVEKKRKPTVKQTIDELVKFKRLLGKQAFVDYKTSQLIGVAIELLKEQQKKKSRDEVLSAIISSLGYTDVETFKRTVLEVDNFEDYFLGGMLRAVQAVEKLFEA